MLPPVASLPMYDWPEVREATDAHWAILRGHLTDAGIDAPATLLRDADHEAAWRSPALALSQCCGWPFATRFADRLTAIGTPAYRAEGCAGPNYRSAIVVRARDRRSHVADLGAARLAANATDSLSGWVTFRATLREHDIAADAAALVLTGSHRGSLRAVAAGEADVAAIDAVCLALARAHEPTVMRSVTVIGWTAPLPALPYVTRVRPSAERSAVRDAVTAAFAAPDGAEARRALLIDGIADVDDAAYRALPRRLASSGNSRPS